MRTKLKIAVGTSEAGGAECLLPAINWLRDAGNEIVVIGGKNALGILNNLSGEFYSFKGGNCFEFVSNILDKNNPDILISGLLGEKNNIDYALIRYGRDKGIRVLSILDSWMNYGDRVLDPWTGDRLGFMPDRIAVMDKIALKGMIEDGIPASGCVITGHPKFDSLLEIKSKRSDAELRRQLRIKYGVNNLFPVMVFYSNPVAAYYPNKFLGYDEQDVFNILTGTRKCLDVAGINISIIFKEHPRGKSINRGQCEKAGFVYLENSDIDELLVVSDIAASMCSTMTIFSAALGMPVLNIQPNLVKSRDLNILTRSGCYTNIESVQQLCSVLSQALREKAYQPLDWLIPDGNVCQRLEKLVLDM